MERVKEGQERNMHKYAVDRMDQDDHHHIIIVMIISVRSRPPRFTFRIIYLHSKAFLGGNPCSRPQHSKIYVQNDEMVRSS